MQNKIKKILEIASTLKYNYSTYLPEINKRLGEKCRIFIHDNLSTNYPGVPKVGQIIIGIKFRYYQMHVGIITEVNEKSEYDYVNLTKEDEEKSINLEWRTDVPKEKIDTILEEIEKAKSIILEIVAEKNNSNLRAEYAKKLKESDAVKSALDMI